jgi:hypothetical protein
MKEFKEFKEFEETHLEQAWVPPQSSPAFWLATAAH